MDDEEELMQGGSPVALVFLERTIKALFEASSLLFFILTGYLPSSFGLVSLALDFKE